MDSSAISVALTVCLLGSSAAGYAFGVLTNKKKAQDLETTLTEWLEDPTCYHDAREAYLSRPHHKPRWQPSGNGQYASLHR